MKGSKGILGILLGMFVVFSQIIYAQNVYTEKAFAEVLMSQKKAGAVAVYGGEMPLTRERAAVLMIQYLGYEGIANGKEKTCSFSDVTTSKGAIELAYELGLMSGTGVGTFSPKEPVTSETAQQLISSLQARLAQKPGWQHACYAISSSSQMSEIAKFDAVSFGWSVLKQTDKGFHVVSDDKSSAFKTPIGFSEPLNLAKANGVESYLMVYFEDKNGLAKSFLEDPVARSQVISELVSATVSFQKGEEVGSFEGITIDFEGFKQVELKESYNTFLRELKGALTAAGKKMNVAVQPTIYFKGYDYKKIGEVSDHVILMAHDYGVKSLSEAERNVGMTTTPLTPIDQVYLALYEAKTQIADTSKIALQFSFGSIQWQSKGGVVQNATAYTPSYDKINARLMSPGTNAAYDSYYQSAYATYSEGGIDHVIWYENAKSIAAKKELARLLGITGESYWRLGIIPTEIQVSQ